jgi:hypothetical protein
MVNSALNIWQDTPMRLDHVSYVTSHEQISDVVNRIGAQIGTAFVDGGIHPRFGTRNFTAPLLNGQYIEIVCPMDHPATEVTPFGKAVKKKSESGGGWLTWVFATDTIAQIEERLGRKAIDGQRKKPDGSDLKWKQIGVLATLEDAQLPFFIEWVSGNHPSTDGTPVAKISKIEISGLENKISNWINQPSSEVVEDIEIIWLNSKQNDDENGILSIEFKFQSKIVSII